MKREHRDALNYLKDSGATDVAMNQGRKHIKVYYRFKGRQLMQVMSCSPSDFRWFDNFKREFSRKVRT